MHLVTVSGKKDLYLPKHSKINKFKMVENKQQLLKPWQKSEKEEAIQNLGNKRSKATVTTRTSSGRGTNMDPQYRSWF